MQRAPICQTTPLPPRPTHTHTHTNLGVTLFLTRRHPNKRDYMRKLGAKLVDMREALFHKKELLLNRSVHDRFPYFWVDFYTNLACYPLRSMMRSLSVSERKKEEEKTKTRCTPAFQSIRLYRTVHTFTYPFFLSPFIICRLQWREIEKKNEKPSSGCEVETQKERASCLPLTLRLFIWVVVNWSKSRVTSHGLQSNSLLTLATQHFSFFPPAT